MDREQAARVDQSLRRALADILDAAFKTSGISRSALAVLVDIPRETLRRNMLTADLTVPQLYRIAAVIGGDPSSWLTAVELRLKDES